MKLMKRVMQFYPIHSTQDLPCFRLNTHGGFMGIERTAVAQETVSCCCARRHWIAQPNVLPLGKSLGPPRQSTYAAACGACRQ
jgi:hypothetical protein